MPVVRPLLALLLAGIAALTLALALALGHLPPAWDPRAPLDVRAEPGPVTGVKLWRLSRDPTSCFAAFAASGMSPVRVPDRPSEQGCAIENAMLFPGKVAAAPRAPVLTCRLAAAWMLFERHTLQPAARQHLGAEVATVRHLGTASCRYINHAATGRRSQHATANAIDVAGFVLRDGSEIRLSRDWGAADARGAFLHEVRDGACRWFRAVLGPEYNAAHAVHLHLDMGSWRACR